MNWLLDLIPWWLWALAGAGLLAATWQIWLPLWRLLPPPLRATLIALGAAVLAYLAGRNRGAAGALQRAREQEQAHADDIRKTGAAARADSDRDAVSGRLRDDDGWKRRDG
ncbi:hypothetical protein [Ancylobacter amanitiformis]|uniref:Uncharacterized protein n=1 Tax=Ancylobacter amanitiformis TaxID=217069 RepID=A0ABU0LM58_9HYPH|nr:hypothetical protein [Ancylobacter amanitiformis]MDQ0509759.1 hypothetical protein [Ancylobacter amanitiformis]